MILIALLAGSMLLAGVGNVGTASSITASGTDSSWTATNTTSNISTSSRTLTVPSGNPGNVKLSISSATATKYSKNGGASIAFITDDIISVATGDTIAFSMTGSVSGDTMTGSVKDSTTGVTIGNVSITHS
jgi:hypothetical protein